MDNFNINKAVLDVPETLQTLSIGKTTLYKLINEGRLKPTKLGSKTLFLAPDIMDFLQSLQANAEEV